MADLQWLATIRLCSKLIRNHPYGWGLRQRLLRCSICLGQAKTDRLAKQSIGKAIMARKIRDHYEADEVSAEPELSCWLCARPMGNVTEWHHPVPKSRGGKERQPVHPICHRTIHANFTNSDLEKRFATVEALLAHPEIGRFVDWIANKPSDFNAPTKERR
jgi:hypothetical protein